MMRIMPILLLWSESIKALGQLEGKRKIAMLGDMLELGDFTEEGHRQVGRLLAEEGYSVVFTFGEAANFIAKEAKLAGLEVHRCNSHLEMANAYNDIREKGDVILVKRFQRPSDGTCCRGIKRT